MSERPAQDSAIGEPEGALASTRTGWHRLDEFLAHIRPHRVGLSLLVDAAVIALCWNITYLFRLGFERFWSARPSYDGWVLAGVVAVYLLAFVRAQVPQSIWRFSGFGEVRRLTLACFAAGLIAAVAVVGLGLDKVPRAVLALHPVVTLMGVCLVRMAYRMLYEHARSRITGSDTEIRRALILGAGEAARQLIQRLPQQGWTLLGLLDDDPHKRGARLGGVRVIGRLHDALDAQVRGAATHLILALPSLPAAERAALLERLAETGLPVLTVPGADEIAADGRSIQRVRPIQPEEVLGREPVVFDEAPVAEMLKGQVVLVTGAGGSIGSELCRQIVRQGPARLVLLDHSEFNLYQIDAELAQAAPGVARVPLLVDVKDAESLERVFTAHQPRCVFHAAAYKHVPLMEAGNSAAGLANNVLGTHRVAEAAGRHGALRFVLVSTDKAVNPTNVMGATKRVAERVVQAQALQHPGTRYVAVRFGNVLGSSGSVIPKFQEQIEQGGPLTVTHPEVIRYFMTIPEAARLVLLAGAVGESGQVMVLDMGEPIRILDLARALLRLAGRTEHEIPIQFSGLRPGEKLYEELLADDELTEPTPWPRLRVARIRAGALPQGLAGWLQQPTVVTINGSAQSGGADRGGEPLQEQAARRLLQAWVPEATLKAAAG